MCVKIHVMAHQKSREHLDSERWKTILIFSYYMHLKQQMESLNHSYFRLSAAVYKVSVGDA